MARRRFRTDERGATLVEFALIAPIVVALLLSILEVATVELISVSFSNAMETISRDIRVGRRTGLQSAADFKALICQNMSGGADCTERMRVDVQSFGSGGGGTFSGFGGAASAPPPPLPTPTGDTIGGAGTTAPTAETFVPGGPRDIVLVTATYRWRVITPFLGSAFQKEGSNLYIRRRMVFRNEPFG